MDAVSVKKTTDNWSQIKNKLHECFCYEAKSIEEKFQKYQKVFPEIGFFYDENQWRNEALNAVNEKKLLKVIEDNNHYVLGSDKKWFYFHLVALEQREYILSLIERIK